jgi:DNA polymerase III subunit epsilon
MLTPSLDRLAFVDLETTGLSPTSNRIKEIGVVTADGGVTSEWSTFLNSGGPLSQRLDSSGGIDRDVIADAPRFKEIAAEIAERLEGRLFVAHNARFDFSFLRAEFARVGIEFHPQVICSVMLSRKLYPDNSHHDLDTLVNAHGLSMTVRHRALPDAQVLWQFWNVLLRDHSLERIESAIGDLLAGPVLPAGLDSTIIDALPDTSGIYAFHGDDDQILKIGKAENLRLYALNYFRLDRATTKALDLAQRVRRISWRRTQGAIGARLSLSVMSKAVLPKAKAKAERSLWTWRVVPDSSPCVEILSLEDRPYADRSATFGLFESEKKAANELRRLATANSLCFATLGIAEAEGSTCLACSLGEQRAVCTTMANRLRHLTRALAVMRPERIESWPYAGPIGIRERADLHVIDDWRYLGTANTEGEMQTILQDRAAEFDQGIYSYLTGKLPKLSRRKILQLATPIFGDSP